VPKSQTPKPEEMTFEQALARLREINAQFEEGDLPLEKALTLYQEGLALTKRCQQLLEEARQIVAKVVAAEGEPQPEPFEPEEEA
jgi:exodeoxyribonuclease VII small subunit